MPKESDKNKKINDSVAVNNIPPNPENNETSSSNLNINSSNPVSNKKDAKPSVRKNMVSKATEFLTAEKIRNTPIEKKVNFLRSRGLTDHEIQLSLQKAAAMYTDTKYSHVNSSLPDLSDINYLKTSGVSDCSGGWLRRLAGSVAIGATAVYIGYQIYKKYIENWLFGMKMSPVEKRLEIVELLIQRCIMLIEEKNMTPDDSTEQNNRQKELDLVRAELKSIKSLLLNRFQFPPAPASSSIPQWQLMKNPKPQTEPQNKINDNDTSNLSPTNIYIKPKSIIRTTVVPQTDDILDSDTVKDNDNKLNNFKSNEITLPLNSDQHIINRHNDVVQNNCDDHNGDKEDENQ
ncbi:Peroxisome membrane anchor protein Pex14p, N-terminal [Cinara cedri]|uniref:Peroxisome membrane anchor protein Pex14p, N-terminal n=1 Tax=Cinara cedri TaxID=506608 RepID=A0A5E4NHI3_9HEMI|nr:Peroxisome membrane anchor protein Pex14p, N-terminal [Cinara cedri]